MSSCQQKFGQQDYCPKLDALNVRTCMTGIHILEVYVLLPVLSDFLWSGIMLITVSC